MRFTLFKRQNRAFKLVIDYKSLKMTSKNKGVIYPNTSAVLKQNQIDQILKYIHCTLKSRRKGCKIRDNDLNLS